jgi:hypothetical protein
VIDQNVNWDDWVGLASYKKAPVTPGYSALDLIERIPTTFLGLFCGNRFGKDYHMEGLYLFKMIAGLLPIERFNMRPADKVRTIRLAAENLPTDKDAEVSSPIYPIIKRLFPKSWIKKDITMRNLVMILNDPQGGKEIFLEFVSYSQDVQAGSGVSRKAIFCSELPPYAFLEEQKPRLLEAGGRLIVSLTSTNANYMYNEFFENARIIVRTPAVVGAYKKYLGKDVKKVEKTDSPHDIGVFMAATDDNPIWPDIIEQQGLKMTVDEYISTYIVGDDPDLVPMRRYGIMKQIGGAIFKDFQWDIHFIGANSTFPNGVPHDWRHGRMIDYHEENPWACIWLALSPENEAFVWKELSPSPANNTILPIAESIGNMTGDYKSHVDLMDPLGAKNQPSVSISVMQDMNRKFLELKRQGRGTGGLWQSWDTKSTKGRDAVKERLKNARLCGKPFNNKIVRDGRTEILPTLWILDNCKETALSLKNWRLKENKDANARVEKDPKEEPQQKWSHFCMCLEAAFKHVAFQHPPRREQFRDHDVPQARYGQTGRRG